MAQDKVARRLGISQSAFARQESVARPRRGTRKKIVAFGIRADQLEL